MSKRRTRSRKRRRDSEPAAAYSGKLIDISFKYRLGRLLQSVGLLILPFGIASELLGHVGLGQSLLIAGAGALIFYVGYVLQNRP